MSRQRTERSIAATRHSQDSDHLDDSQFESTIDTDTHEKSTLCCVRCFQLISETPLEDRTDLSEPTLLCTSCFQHLSGKTHNFTAVHSSGSRALSPLPKLSLLVKAEAKCQDQLQLLQSQQQVLQQQRQSLLATKQAKEEALAVERKLARRRRKHFLIIQECRKREEELKLQQYLDGGKTSCSKQDGAYVKKKLKPRRRKSEPTAELSVQISKTVSKHDETVHSIASKDRSSSHPTNSLERRKQVLACYAQDLSPLVEGHKPRRLLLSNPVTAAGSSVNTTKSRKVNLNSEQLAVTAITTQTKNKLKCQTIERKLSKLRSLKIGKQIGKFNPQHYKKNNQFDEVNRREMSKALCKVKIASPQTSYHFVDRSTSLTAEIKPVSWASGLLPQLDLKSEEKCVDFSRPLQAVAVQHDNNQQITIAPSNRQLSDAFLPATKRESLAYTTLNFPRWEYSTERLSSLLKKYNVPVPTATTTADT
ncbi:uncharacterized protein PHALS_12408 [Plasmopara halstedii]|uniref:Uncharacterized protein n=1 Tax=Plasmopara halstedii TaxID=4781 RepID=A0A0P1ALC0_PLAHL|nr:uncharacterized protein PHALS_12408 [Plasmopara halstedii]CEG42104.1 hypothetical protein PHALS_12408 [Plasmopara halstedii]|eukprot:XP_024578473.1 hypothetical protein PHALS_12408 [Plasmopara halstedii]